MKEIKIIDSKKGTFFIKKKGIPRGCELCLRGEKTVLFINGFCQNPPHCFWYCPISKERKNKSQTYANEIRVNEDSDLLKEIKLTQAKGMSITGGDPLYERNLDKTIKYIKLVKSRLGKKFHVHLYTNGLNFNEEIANKLTNAGLDEIRFNPPQNKWSSIKIALNKGMKVGAEVPVIPDENHMKEIKNLILFLEKIGADFINLNEFEINQPNSKFLKERGYKLKEGTIASVDGSREKALELLNELAPLTSLKIHFCTIKAKDYWQLRERYLRRAEMIKEPYEVITNDGLVIYAQIEGNEREIKKFYEKLILTFKKFSKIIIYENNLIKLPIFVAIDDDFINMVDNQGLKMNVVESTPFREKEYKQITEITPIRLFKKEYYIK
ncbi:MAG: radical SAM protein [Promethearchaeota archaeon]